VNYRLSLSRLGLAATSLAVAGISASLAITSLGEGENVQARSNEILLLALVVTIMNAVLVWFWLPKTWAQAGRSKSLRLIVSLLAVAVATALIAGVLFLI